MPVPMRSLNIPDATALFVTISWSWRTRWEALPDIPTIGEFVPGYEASGWHGIGAPKGMPVQIVDRLNTEINASLADPKMKARLAELGDTVLPGSPAGFGQFIADEAEK